MCKTVKGSQFTAVYQNEESIAAGKVTPCKHNGTPIMQYDPVDMSALPCIKSCYLHRGCSRLVTVLPATCHGYLVGTS